MKHLVKLLVVGLLLMVPVRYFLDWADIAPFEYFEGAPPPPPPPVTPFFSDDPPSDGDLDAEVIEIVGIDPNHSKPEPSAAGDTFRFVLVLSDEPSDAWFEQMSNLIEDKPEFESVIDASGDTLSLSCSTEAFTGKFFPELKTLIDRCNAAMRTAERARVETIESVVEKLSLPLEYGTPAEDPVPQMPPVGGN